MLDMTRLNNGLLVIGEIPKCSVTLVCKAAWFDLHTTQNIIEDLAATLTRQ